MHDGMHHGRHGPTSPSKKNSQDDRPLLRLILEVPVIQNGVAGTVKNRPCHSDYGRIGCKFGYLMSVEYAPDSPKLASQGPGSLRNTATD